MVELIGSGEVESRVVALEPAVEPLGARVRRLRLERGLSLRSLAMRLGCDHSLIVRWERGDREPAPQDLARLARVLRTTTDDLLTGADLGCGRVASSRSHGHSSRERLGARIRTLRRRSSITPWEVFVATGIDGRRLRTIEAGADPSLAELRAIAEVLGSSLHRLLVEPPRQLGLGVHRPRLASGGRVADPLEAEQTPDAPTERIRALRSPGATPRLGFDGPVRADH